MKIFKTSKLETRSPIAHRSLKKKSMWVGVARTRSLKEAFTYNYIVTVLFSSLKILIRSELEILIKSTMNSTTFFLHYNYY